MLTREQISMALLTLEDVGLITVDEEDMSFEPTDEGLVDECWLTELQKLLPGIEKRSN